MALQTAGRTTIAQGVRNLTTFKIGNVKGEWGYINRGQLPWEIKFPEDRVYVVYSYKTPIAWYRGGEWTVPAVHYSLTTTNHQNVVKAAVTEATNQQLGDNR